MNTLIFFACLLGLNAHAFIEDTTLINAKIIGFDQNEIHAQLQNKNCVVLRSKILNNREFKIDELVKLHLKTADLAKLKCKKNLTRSSQNASTEASAASGALPKDR